jgi:hypothetical protein
MKVAPQSRHASQLELATEILREFSGVRFVAQGTSMLPAIYPGDRLTVRSFGLAPPRRGDIVLCRRNAEFRVHRIVSILDNGPTTLYVLRGDSLTLDDPPLAASDILGRVTSIARRGRTLDAGLPEKMRYSFLRSVVCHSRIAAVLLLRWHALRTRAFLKAQSVSVGPAPARTECP